MSISSHRGQYVDENIIDIDNKVLFAEAHLTSKSVGKKLVGEGTKHYSHQKFEKNWVLVWWSSGDKNSKTLLSLQ